jgi:trigger factor
MQLTVRPTGAWQHTLDIQIPSDEVERGLDDVARKVQRRAALPGFRKGKVPLPYVRQHFAEAVEQQFLDDFLPQATGQALQESKLDPVVPPLLRNLSMVPGQPMTFQAVVEVRPDVEPKDYKGLRISRSEPTVEETAVDEMLERLRADSAVFLDLDRPAQRGDVLIVDSVRLDANGRRLVSTRARNLRLELGAPGMLPDLENGLLAAQTGQERTIEVSYPADHPTAELAGKQVRYLVRVKKIQEKKLRDLDDNLAKEVFQVPTLEELRAQVRRNLEREAQNRTRREVEEAITEELIRRNPFDLPERLVEWTLDRMVREAAGRAQADEALLESMRERYRPAIVRSLKRELLLAAVARKESLTVGDEDVSAEIERMVEADPRQAARIRARYQSADRRRALAASLLEHKAMESVISAATVEETSERRIVPATR